MLLIHVRAHDHVVLGGVMGAAGRGARRRHRRTGLVAASAAVAARAQVVLRIRRIAQVTVRAARLALLHETAPLCARILKPDLQRALTLITRST